jgi:hypothetical protein
MALTRPSRLSLRDSSLAENSFEDLPRSCLPLRAFSPTDGLCGRFTCCRNGGNEEYLLVGDIIEGSSSRCLPKACRASSSKWSRSEGRP